VTTKQCLEGPVTVQMIQEIGEKEGQVKQQVEASQHKLKAFEATFSTLE
jgi:hypothetical protein